jgi:alpha-tubulin suppressor-like RCC1 family protein
MNIANLILQLESKISDNTLDQQMISKAIRLLEVGAVKVVAGFGNMPLPSEAPLGDLYFVEGSYLYYNRGTMWDAVGIPTQNIIWAWGFNSGGLLGDGTTVNKSSPVSIIGGFTDWCQISAGVNHNLGVRTNGTVWAWGCGTSGRLGDGTTVNKSSPVSVVGGFTDWCQVSAGYFHSLGLRSNGSSWTWGSNTYGALGDNTLVTKSSPVSVVGGFTWCQVAAGGSHSLAIRNNGTAWAWGRNHRGQLGDGTTVNKSSPVAVVGGFTWCHIAASRIISVGLRSNGSLWSWGSNNYGQLGDNTTVSKSSPVAVVGGFCDWCQVSTAGYSTLAVRTNGTAWAWGRNGQGQLGDNSITQRNSPVSVVGGFTDWCQVSAGYFHSVGVRTNGTAWAWGCNGLGNLGNGTTVSQRSPILVAGGFTDWCQVSAHTHNLGIRSIPI